MKKTIVKLTPCIGVGSLCSPLEVGADRADEAVRNLIDVLKEAGCDVVEIGIVDNSAKSTAAGRKLAESHVDAIAFTVVSWFEDYLVLDLLEECHLPVLLWPLPGMETGALCGTQQLTAYLKQLNTPFASVFGESSDAECRSKALAFLRGAALKSRLRRCRIGIAGHHVNGMTHTAPNEFMLKKVIGPRVVQLDLSQLLARVAEMPKNKAHALWEKVRSRAAKCDVDEKEGLDSMQMYLAIKEQVERHGLDALTIGCYPNLMGHVCLAASLLADEGIPLACEGDVHGALGQLMLTLLTGEPTHNTDWLDPMEDGTVVFTHCGSGSFSLAEKPEDIILTSVRLMGQGVCALFTAKPGPVTLLSINTYPAGYQCALLEGEALSTKMVFPGNPVRIKFNKPIKELIEWIHTEGIGHHWMIGYGHVGAEIRAWSDIVGQQLRLVKM